MRKVYYLQQVAALTRHIQHDVPRVDGPVRDLLLPQHRDHRQQLRHYTQHILQTYFIFSLQQLQQVQAFHFIEDQVGVILLYEVFVESADIRVLESLQDLDFL